jgi:hypothetical protein
MDPLGSRHVRGLVARNWHGFSRLSGSSRQKRAANNVDRVDKSTALGEFVEREIAMRRVKELVGVQHGVGDARLGTISIGKGETIMCGRVRLSSDYSEIKIRLKFAPKLRRAEL